MRNLLRWLFSNLGALLLSLALAVVVWVSAVTASNPNVERTRSVPIEIVGLDPDMLLVGEMQAVVQVTLRSPQSVADSMENADKAVRAWVDVAGLDAGTYDLEIKTQVNSSFWPLSVVTLNPQVVTITLEPLVAQPMPINLEVSGDPAIGYQEGLSTRLPASVTVSGAASLVEQVDEVRASLDISDASETIETELPLLALNAQGEPVSGVTITPNKASVSIPISLQGGYRNVIVKVVTIGQPANGFKLTNISVSPLNVVVFSTDPRLVNDLPGYVETQPVNLSGVEDDIDTFVDLNLPQGVSVVGDQNVLLQVSVAAIEGSLTLSLPVTPIGLSPLFAAQISPASVDVILSGPVPVLDRMNSSDIRVVVDLKDLELGTYQLQPIVDVLPERVLVETILPSTVEITIITAPTPSPTGSATPPVVATPQP